MVTVVRSAAEKVRPTNAAPPRSGPPAARVKLAKSDARRLTRELIETVPLRILPKP